MQNDFITKLIDLKRVKVTKFRNREHRIRIHIGSTTLVGV